MLSLFNECFLDSLTTVESKPNHSSSIYKLPTGWSWDSNIKDQQVHMDKKEDNKHKMKVKI